MTLLNGRNRSTPIGQMGSARPLLQEIDGWADLADSIRMDHFCTILSEAAEEERH